MINNDSDDGNHNQENEDKAQKEQWDRRVGGSRAILGGIFIHFTLGVIYSWGNMEPYITSYMRNIKHLDCRHSELGYVLSSAFSGQAIGLVSGGLIESSIGPCYTTYLGGFVLSLSFLCSSFLLHSKVGFILTYGFTFGIGLGICYTSPLSCALRWLPHHRGLVSGLITAGLGLSSLFFNLFQTKFINPYNLSPELLTPGDLFSERYFTDPNLLNHVPPLIRYSSLICLVLISIGGTLLVDPPDFERSRSSGCSVTKQASIFSDSESLAVDSALRPSLFYAKATTEPQHEFSPYEAFRTNRFLFLYLLFLLQSPSITFVAGQWKSAPATLFLDDMYLSLLGALAAICNACGRICWGQLSDLLSPTIALLVLSAIWFVSMVVSGFFATSSILYTATTCINFFCFGGNYALFPAFTSIAFGRRFLGTIYGVLFLSQLIGSNLSSVLTQKFISTVHYNGLCYLYSMFILSCFVLTLTFGWSLSSTCPHPPKPIIKSDLESRAHETSTLLHPPG